ncbi:MAG: dihydrolipoyl dehydrogenase [Burkholderiaceae bacterium]|nr:dihydrolipoyl dehydrogenase [Burkholderiaceae bacterium]
MNEIRCNLLVVGAGPGGYVCAARAGEQGVDTVIVEADRVGGTCLNVGCIPSKALIHAADEYARLRAFCSQRSPLGIRASEPAIDLAQTVAWKDAIVERLDGGVSGMLKKARVKVVLGRARFRDGKTVVVSTETGGEQTIRAENVVVATGSRPVELPMLPFGGNVVSSTELLSMRELPARLVVVGAGYIGVELGTAFAKLGSQVTMVDLAPRILPQYDAELTRPVAQRLAALGVQLRLGATVKGVSDGQLTIETGAGAERLPADRILVAVGRRPATDGFALEELDLDRDGPYLRIDDRCRTSMRGVYAIGDVTGEPMLAHRAMMQGEVVADLVAGRKRVFEPRAIPAICFTDPEIVAVGPGLEEARRAHAELRIGMVPFTANGRALTLQAESGFVRIVARADNHLILSMQAVGAGVSELSAAFGLALEMGARLEDIAGTIHAHPTLGEAIQEAAQRALARG